jgi:prepilin-type N-terminal cleavage/methylation domain-containing protein
MRDPIAPPRPVRRGYTLIELIIVIGILGLAGALLVPVIGDRGSFDTQAAVRRLVADLTFAQSDAVANQEHRRLIFLPDEENEGRFRGWAIVRLNQSELGLAFDAAAAKYVHDPLAPAGQSGQYVVDILADERFGQTFVAEAILDGGAAFVTFDEMGGTVTSTGQPGTGGSIVLRGGAASYRITIEGLTGRVTVADISNEELELELEIPVPPEP